MSTEQNTEQKPPQEFAREPIGDEAQNPAPSVAGQPAIEQPAPRDEDEHPAPQIDSNVDRANIAKKFSRLRQEHSASQPFNGNMADPVLRGGVSATPPEPDPPEPDQPAEIEARESGPSDSQPKPKRKIVVRREEREVDEDELIRLAQIGAANEGYVSEARNLLEETRRVVSSRPHPGAEPDADPSDANQDGPHPDPYENVVEKMQFGNTAEAAEALRTTTAKTTDEAAAKAVYTQQRTLDVGRATRAYEAFKTSNADLLSDPISETALERIYHDELRNDLRKIGYPDDKIPKARDALVETHRFHRIHGQPVREVSELLDAAKTGFSTWRGGQQQQPVPKPSSSKVEVRVDRTERRSAIPQQPSRAAVPPQQTQQPAPGNTRKTAVQKMMQSRGQLTAS